MTRAPRIPFMSLAPGEDAAAVRAAIDRVIARGWFVLGPEVEAFEPEFAAASGAAHAVGVGNGTDAIALILRALGIGAGDEVITTPLSAAYTALAIMMTGARPVFADIDPARADDRPRARSPRAIGPRTRAILPVHLYGQAADMAAIERDRRAAQPADRRGLLPGAPRDRRRTAGRHDRRRRRVQLLPDQESRRARRRRRRRHQRSRARRPAQAAAQRRPDRPLSPPGAGHQLAARRDAGGDSARAAAASARLDRRAGARWRRAIARGWRARRSTLPPRARPGPRLSSVRRPAPATRRDLQAHLAGARHRDADALSGADSAAAGARRARSGRLPGRGARCATRCCRCRSIPRCATTRSTRSPRRCTPSNRGRWPPDERTHECAR